MKKFLFTSLLFLAACSTTGGLDDVKPVPKPGKAEVSSSKGVCGEGVKGVKDPENGGKIYYTKSHPLYSFIKVDTKQGDRNFCSVADARKNGFGIEAPAHFKDSTHNYISCLKSESSGNGPCHTYASGIYMSLKIYGKVCGPASPSNKDLEEAVINNAEKSKNGMEVGKYYGVTSGLLNRYGCRGRK